MESSLIVTPAAALFESAPFIFATAALHLTPLRRVARLAPFLACGCGTGPAARSLPAAVMTCMTFGPAVALGRFAAAVLAAHLLRPREPALAAESCALDRLASLLPSAAAASCIALFAQQIAALHLAAPLALAYGAAGAFLFSPCAIGQVAIAASLRSVSPYAAAGFLCVAGIGDLRAVLARHCHPTRRHDALAYAMAAFGCALLAAHHGNGMLHPRLVPLLLAGAATAAVLAILHRTQSAPQMRIAPAIMLAGCMFGAPPPAYHVTETTLAQAFPGETIAFTGVATQTANATTLVRYAITCCRADAAPIVVRLARALPRASGWMHADGTFVMVDGKLRLDARRIAAVAPPTDAFVYR